MTPLRKRMIEDLRIRNYSPRTIETYVRLVAGFARYHGRSPDVLGTEDVRAYQVHLLEQKVSWAKFNQTVCALRFPYRVTLKRDWPLERLPPSSLSRRPERLHAPPRRSGRRPGAASGARRRPRQTRGAAPLLAASRMRARAAPPS
ncbi:MAG: site-specific integrase [Myxococcota bacterium]